MIPWMFPNRSARVTFGLVVLGVTTSFNVRTFHRPGVASMTEAVVGMTVAGLGLLVWLWVGQSHPLGTAALTAVGAGGGLASSVWPGGLIFVAMAAGGAAVALAPPRGLGLGALGPLAFLVASAARGTLPGRLAVVVIVALVGYMAGGTRRQAYERTRQATLVAMADERSAVAAREAALVAERNRLGRELHDVLAHTLGALSVQLSALDALVAAGADPSAVRAEVERSHRLVDEGLDEAHQAVRALRDNRRPLCEELADLCSRHRAAFAVTGSPAPVGAEASLALYRVAQEAMTNAAKHAPGSPVTVQATYDGDGVCLTVSNPLGANAPRPPRAGGFGLVGMRERILLVGGRCEAGPEGGSWRVRAQVPR